MPRPCLFLLLAGLMLGAALRAESGYDLWLRYRPVENPAVRTAYARVFRNVQITGGQDTTRVIRDELTRAARGLVGADPVFVSNSDGATDVSLYVSGSPDVGANWALPAGALSTAGAEGFVIRSVRRDGKPGWIIAANSDAGALYGVFRFLRQMQLRKSVDAVAIAETPAIHCRVLNQWDNLDGTVERGYAGKSLWQWNDLPEKIDPRYADYARANASIGINAIVVNNVNSGGRILLPSLIAKVAALAAVFRPYGIRVYLAVNCDAPMRPNSSATRAKKSDGIGTLDTADPLAPTVRQWWHDKVEEIYRAIPDFGGFLVKANSEGQPGPQDYGRTHADGANVLAAALAPHGGVVFWRAFVYPKNGDRDRAKRSYGEFVPLDGKFAANVFVQVKNGPLDFQPHEPFHPLFGAMPRTPLALELQITQEYLGQSTHLVFLGSEWQEVLAAETAATKTGATIARVIEGALGHHEDSAIAGVANVGTDQNWCGHDFAAANWYAFGRLAWEPTLTADAIAREWAGQTFSTDPAAINTLTTMMLRSWPAAVNYFSPLGLSFTMDSQHYDPGLAHREGQFWASDHNGLGYDRSSTGSKFVQQYNPAVAQQWDDPETCPLADLLFFHVVAWDHRLSTGRTLWEELCERYRSGVREVEANLARWQSLAGQVDPERYERVRLKLEAQLAHARRWRDESIEYFHRRSGRPVPPDASH